GAAVARVLHLVDAALRSNAEELVHEDADRLRVVDAGLRRDDEHADLAWVDARRAQTPRRRRRGQRDDVLARCRQPHRLPPEPGRQLLRPPPPRLRQRRQRQRVLWRVAIELLDPDAHRAPSPSIARYWPSAIRGK